MGFPDTTLDGLEGSWHLEGVVLGKRLVQDVTVEWVLNGAYLRIHYRPSTVTPLTEEPYEAIAYVGWDPDDGGRFVMYLLDTFGAAYPALGYGSVVDDAGVRFEFDYPQGRFLTDIRADGDEWLIEQVSIDDLGKPVPFGSKRLTRSST